MITTQILFDKMSYDWNTYHEKSIFDFVSEVSYFKVMILTISQKIALFKTAIWKFAAKQSCVKENNSYFW